MHESDWTLRDNNETNDRGYKRRTVSHIFSTIYKADRFSILETGSASFPICWTSVPLSSQSLWWHVAFIQFREESSLAFFFDSFCYSDSRRLGIFLALSKKAMASALSPRWHYRANCTEHNKMNETVPCTEKFSPFRLDLWLCPASETFIDIIQKNCWSNAWGILSYITATKRVFDFPCSVPAQKCH